MRRKTEICVLVIYTILNLKMMWPFFDYGILLLDGDSFSGGATVFLGLFLNAGLILYWLNIKES